MEESEEMKKFRESERKMNLENPKRRSFLGTLFTGGLGIISGWKLNDKYANKKITEKDLIKREIYIKKQKHYRDNLGLYNSVIVGRKHIASAHDAIILEKTMSQILKSLGDRAKEYEKTNPAEYNLIVGEYRVLLIEYFSWIIESFKTCYPDNYQVNSFHIK